MLKNFTDREQLILKVVLFTSILYSIILALVITDFTEEISLTKEANASSDNESVVSYRYVSSLAMDIVTVHINKHKYVVFESSYGISVLHDEECKRKDQNIKH